MQSVTSKVGTPVSLTAQRFTVQIPPPSQTVTTKTSKSMLTNKTILYYYILGLHLSDVILSLGNTRSVVTHFTVSADIN